jgi:6-phosphogluconolactonase
MKMYANLFPLIVMMSSLLPMRGGVPQRFTGPRFFVYVGTALYTGRPSEGIYAYIFHPSSELFEPLGLVAKTVNPGFLAIDPSGQFLYTVNEISQYKGMKSGAVSAFAIDRKTGALRFLNEVPSGDPNPTYVTTDQTGHYVLVANYYGGLATFPISKAGFLGTPTAYARYHGSADTKVSGPVTSHPHCVELSSDNRVALVADLGSDKVLPYRFDSASGELNLDYSSIASLDQGSGPRHLTFSPSGKFVYVINELQSSIAAFSYDHVTRRLAPLQEISTLPPGVHGQNTGAEIKASNSGEFLYASNRGNDSIAVFAINQSAGTLDPVQDISTEGRSPRSFEIDPTGSYLFAANQDSNSIVIFRIDRESGRLISTGWRLRVTAPVCVKVLLIK